MKKSQYRAAAVVLITSGFLCALAPVTRADDFPPFDPYRSDHARTWPVKTDFQILGGGIILTLGALSTESPERAVATLEDATAVDGALDAGNAYGSAWVALGMTAGVTAFGVLGGRPELTRAGVDMTKALALAGVAVWTLKLTVERARPNGAMYSFPSGHTATAFATAPVLQAHFGWKVGAPAYALATLTAFGRMEENRHYFSDVIAGATIGILAGRFASRGQRNLSVYGDSRGAGFSFNF